MEKKLQELKYQNASKHKGGLHDNILDISVDYS